jgi:hypothetical protein
MLGILLLFIIMLESSCFMPLPSQNVRKGKVWLSMSTPGGDPSLLDAMKEALGESEDILASAQDESKKLMKGLREMDRDPGMVENSRFIEWLSNNGVWVKTESAWGKAQHPLVIATNTEDDGESCGRGNSYD